ncbi:MAG: phenylacetate--CoA ligase family protein [Candidatus Bathyarchaeota archaeon]
MPICPYIANRLVFPIGDRIWGTHIMRFLSELEEKQWWSPEEIKIEQDDKLNKLIKHSYENVPYWRELFNKLKLRPSDIKTKDDLRKLPVLSKDDIRKNLDRMLAENFPKKRFIEKHSSGSTGEPLKYYVDKEKYSWNLASMLCCWKWAGYEFGQKWVRVQLWPHSKLSEKVLDKLARCTYIGTYKFDDEAIEKAVLLIKRKKPRIIRGYTSAIYLIAKFMKENEVEKFKAQAVITTSETIFPHYRSLIEEQFDCKVYDVYGGEGMTLCGQCERGNYHIDDNSVVVEFLKDDGNNARSGELANIIVTDLTNFAMPFIRYRIQDLGKPLDRICNCGRGLSLMGSIEGRDSDIIRTLDGKYLMVQFFVVFFEYLEGVEQFQVIQRELDEIEIKIVKNDKFTKKDMENIGKAIKEGGGERLKVRFNFVDNIPLERSGKRRFVISEIDASSGK